MSRDLITLGLAVAAYLGYYGFADSVNRAWANYVGTGALMAWMAWRERQPGPRRSTGVGIFAATYIVIEAAQQAIFGALSWGKLPTGKDLGVELLGEPVYTALTSLLLAGVWTWRRALWPSRQAPR